MGTRVLSPAEIEALRGDEIPLTDAELAGHVVLEHERLPFPSFPYEWPPEMLHAAAELTLALAEELLPEGLGIKDGTPYNVLFRGPEPVFVDVLSFERRDPQDPTWLAYAQFVRTFLLPLLANKHFGLALDQCLTTRRDGLEPEEIYRWAGPLQKIRPPFLTLVSIPAWLSSRHDADDASVYERRSTGDPEKARFILQSLLHGLRRKLDALAPRSKKKSTWSEYMATHSYERAQFEAKQAFVQKAIAELRPARVLDVGCNTGHFSALAARGGASVVAIDYDPVVVGEVWRHARTERLDILPLVVNLTRPTPGVGWRNAECAAFLDRARGAFDGVLMLAVIHHMLVTERIPLEEVLSLAGELTTGWAVIEFIAPQDAMFRRITRGRDALHADLTVEQFEEVSRRWFNVVRSERIADTHRWLFLLRKK